MKFSVVVTGSDAVFSALTFKGELFDGMKMAKELGYDAVELALRDPESLNVETLELMLKDLNIGVSAIGTGRAYTEEGLSLSSDNDEVRHKAIQRIKAHIRLARELRCFVIIGLMRGNPTDPRKAYPLLAESLSELDSYAKANGVKLLLEPINPQETSLLNTVSQTYEFIKLHDYRNVGLLVDTYHMYRTEEDMFRSIEEHSDLVWYVHVADHDRDVPGTGEIDFQQLFNTLRGIGYDGYVSLECVSKLSPYETAKRNIEYLKGILERC